MKEKIAEDMRESGLDEQTIQKIADPLTDSLMRTGSWEGVMQELVEHAPAMVEEYSRARFKRH